MSVRTDTPPPPALVVRRVLREKGIDVVTVLTSVLQTHGGLRRVCARDIVSGEPMQ
jgi:hypothetical protein